MKNSSSSSRLAVRRASFAAAIAAAGVDLSKDFFELSFSEISTVHDLAKTFKYRRPAGFPGSLGRAFYYSAQRAALAWWDLDK